MTIELLLAHTAQSPHQTEQELYCAMALYILKVSSSSSLIPSAKKTKLKLEKLHAVTTEPTSGKKYFAKARTIYPSNHFLDVVTAQQKLLAKSRDDDFVLLLACLKMLDELGCDANYLVILKEIISHNLHRLTFSNSIQHLVGRDHEIEDARRMMGESGSNSLLIVGPQGVGKTSLAKALLAHYTHHEVYQLFPGNSAVIDQITHLLVSSVGKPVLFFLDDLFSFDLTQIRHLLANTTFVATAHDTAYRKFNADNAELISKAKTLLLAEPAEAATLHMLEARLMRIQSAEHVQADSTFAKEVYTLAKRYMPHEAFPAKALTLLEETAAQAKTNHLDRMNIELLRSVVSQKTHVPVSTITGTEAEDLNLLPDKLRARVKGQDEAVTRVSQIIQRSRLGFGRKNRPIGSFLFVGPSGVGKTELAKAVAHSVFGDEDQMVRLDMSEFAEVHNVQRLVGAPPGYIGFEEGGQLTNPISTKPYNLVLLDELEKAHPRVFDIFLQVLEDGRLTDGRGKVVDFRNTLITATTNAGIEDILDMIADGKSHKEIETEVKDILQDYFRIEFINRFDGIILFNTLGVPALKDIARLQLQRLADELAQRNITLNVSEDSLRIIAEESHDPRYGARELLRYIQDTIENRIAEMLLTGTLKEGQSLTI